MKNYKDFVTDCPKIIEIIAPSGIVTIGDVLTCVADGYPTATYEWEESITGDRTTGNTVIVSAEGDLDYTCTATVVIKGVPCSISARKILVIISNKFEYNVLKYFKYAYKK